MLPISHCDENQIVNGYSLSGPAYVNMTLRGFINALHDKTFDTVLTIISTSKFKILGEEIETTEMPESRDYHDIVKEVLALGVTPTLDKIIKKQIRPMFLLDIPVECQTLYSMSDPSGTETGVFVFGGKQVAQFKNGKSDVELPGRITYIFDQAAIWDIVSEREEPRLYASKSLITPWFHRRRADTKKE